MRKDHFSPPGKWTREFRQALKLSDAHFKVYAYLEGGLETHATGVFFVTLSAVAEMVMDDRDNVARIMGDLEKIGLILWDEAADVVLVHCVCAEQFRWTGKPKTTAARDYRVVEAKRHLATLPVSNLVEIFLARWPIFRPDEGATQAPTQAPVQGATQAPTPRGYPQGLTKPLNTSTCSFSKSNPPSPTPRRADWSKTDRLTAIRQDADGLDILDDVEVAS